MRVVNFLLFSILLTQSYSVAANFYEAPLNQSRWQFNQSKTLCHLKHKISHYGSADFFQHSGQPLVFALQIKQAYSPVIQASLNIRAPAWMHAEIADPTHSVSLDGGTDERDGKRLSVRGEVAELMLNALNMGQFPTFTYIREKKNVSILETRVAVSAVNFIEAHEKFLLCLNQLLPFRFEDIQDRTLLFDNLSTVLSSKTQHKLNRIGEYLKAVDDATVVIGSDTSRLGGKIDRKWFTSRVKPIKAYLNKNGIASKRIKVQRSLPYSDVNSKVVRVHLLGPETLHTYYYSSKQLAVNAKEKHRLDLLAAYVLKHFSMGKLIINSYTDSFGTRQANKTISLRRANEIKNYLVAKGVSVDRMIVRAYGERKPAYSNRGREGRWRNRRVRIDFAV